MQKPSTTHIAFASFIGTAIEFYDFYIYAMAAALVIGQVFFPASDPATQSLNAFLTFGIAFIARPVGAIVFGHFGDKVGRKATLAASLLLMGISTLLIGLLPGYDTLGIWAPIALCILRFGQGLGLGGEWGGAALLATEHAPAGKRAWFGMFPQLGPSVGFLMATLSYLALSLWLTDAQFKAWGWRLPFIASALLVGVGLYVRFKLAETPAFASALAQHKTHAMPIKPLLSQHLRPVLLGALAMVVCYNLFYTATVFCLSYGTANLGFTRSDFLGMLCVAILFMTLATPISAKLSDIYGRKPVLLFSGALAVLAGFALSPLLESGSVVQVTLFLSLALFLMGATFAPMGAYLPEQFPVAVRYTGAGLAYQLGGILGASMAPYISQVLVTAGGLAWVGAYVSIAAAVSFIAVLLLGERRGSDLL
ncbi:MFS transporter [Methylotenera mobilis]|uniref:Major facilitator superfamily MFS_1 n=1 Tax=Methylotenera mobilis (strain JLW8 / ATCC BAA-1282 / DSM 17540) TaxID=583345 RepID=C6WTJ4_METML|nr:MFS transporter [Methylotenera mobilis]ACT47316.1 major facilitator superfamily MFS_1 [Methylotenera mobilis JLW8]